MLQKGGHVISFTKELEKSAAIADDKDMRVRSSRTLLFVQKD